MVARKPYVGFLLAATVEAASEARDFAGQRQVVIAIYDADFHNEGLALRN
jgi:hypothetical protein